MSNLNKEAPVFYMSMDDGEVLNEGPYKSREDAALEAPEIRQQYFEDHDDMPTFFTVCKIIPSVENAINETTKLPERIQEFIDDWINDNVEGGTEDGVIEIQDSAEEVLRAALIDVLTNHSIYHGNGAAVDCIETKFDISEVTDD